MQSYMITVAKSADCRSSKEPPRSILAHSKPPVAGAKLKSTFGEVQHSDELHFHNTLAEGGSLNAWLR
jgi:hypothetical protein